jgi:hypothetical protein
VLTAGLEDDTPAVRLYAAIVLAAIGSRAQLALPDVTAALDKETGRGDYSMYIRWALERVVRQTRQNPD